MQQVMNRGAPMEVLFQSLHMLPTSCKLEHLATVHFILQGLIMYEACFRIFLVVHMIGWWPTAGSKFSLSCTQLSGDHYVFYCVSEMLDGTFLLIFIICFLFS
jgi:hypothetical protein